MFYGYQYYIYMLPAMLLMMAAQWYVNSSFKRWNKVPNYRRISGAQAADLLAKQANLNIKIEQVGGKLSDHYDPRSKTLRLSTEVYGGYSVASLAIAAHELGHAVQDQERYPLLGLRSAMVPTVNIGSRLGWIVIIGGLILNMTELAYIGLALFSMTAVFALITLPVELNASSRARELLDRAGLTRHEEERKGVRRVLNAAALTYVASLISSLIQVMYWASRITGRRRS